MIFSRTDLWISLETKRGCKDGLNNRVHAQCQKCSRHCTISSSVQSGFPSVYVDKLAAVFSSLCVEPDVEQDAPLDGQQNPLSDASE